MVEIIDRGKQYKTGRYYWHVQSVNGQILCTSETYNSKQAARKGLLAAMKTIGDYIEASLKN